MSIKQPTFRSPVTHSESRFAATNVVIPLLLFDTHRRLQPRRPRPRKLLYPRFQHRLMFLKVINLPKPQNRHSRKAGWDSIHQTAANAAEVVCHGVACCNGVGLGEFGDFLLAADVAEGVAFEEEVGGEHWTGDFSVVGAMADELGNEIRNKIDAGGGLVD